MVHRSYWESGFVRPPHFLCPPFFLNPNVLFSFLSLSWRQPREGLAFRLKAIGRKKFFLVLSCSLSIVISDLKNFLLLCKMCLTKCVINRLLKTGFKFLLWCLRVIYKLSQQCNGCIWLNRFVEFDSFTWTRWKKSSRNFLTARKVFVFLVINPFSLQSL